MGQNESFIGEDRDYKRETNYQNQICFCGVIHDYPFKGRIIECLCGYLLKEDSGHKHKLIRVG